MIYVKEGINGICLFCDLFNHLKKLFEIKSEFVDHIKMENSLEDNKIDKLSKNLLLNKNTLNAEFIKTNTGLNLSLDYIPKELFINFQNKKANQMNANEQINNISFEPKNIQNSNSNDK